MAVIEYSDQWISLTEVALRNFFQTLRDLDKFENVNGKYYSERLTEFKGEFFTNTNENTKSINITFMDEECDHSTINNFNDEDLIALLKMERIIGVKITEMKVSSREIVEKIEGIADECSEDPYHIYEKAVYVGCGDIMRELSVNHFGFFYDFVGEKKSNEDTIV